MPDELFRNKHHTTGTHTTLIRFILPILMVMYVPCMALLLHPSLFAGRNLLIAVAWLVLWMLPFLFLADVEISAKCFFPVCIVEYQWRRSHGIYSSKGIFSLAAAITLFVISNNGILLCAGNSYRASVAAHHTRGLIIVCNIILRGGPSQRKIRSYCPS